MGPPDQEPLGLRLTRTARVVSRAFDDALSAAGGSLPQWLILVELKSAAHGNQRNIAQAVGVEAATLTHHLNRMETAGLVSRRRDPDNRRVHQVELTVAGEKLFHTLRQKVAAFDRQLREGFSDREIAQLQRLLERLGTNASEQP